MTASLLPETLSTRAAREAFLQAAHQFPASQQWRCRAFLDLMGACRAIESALRREVTRQELSEAGFMVLATLSARDPEPVAVSELSGHSEMWEIIVRLEVSGLVSHVRDPENRRVILLQMTPGGRKKFFSVMTDCVSKISTAMNGFDEAATVSLLDVCDKINAGASKIAKSTL